jgi:hypothetical protein
MRLYKSLLMRLYKSEILLQIVTSSIYLVQLQDHFLLVSSRLQELVYHDLLEFLNRLRYHQYKQLPHGLVSLIEDHSLCFRMSLGYLPIQIA